MRDANAPDYTLGIVGAGAMGSGIAQAAAQGGVSVRLFDAMDGAAGKARETIAARLTKRADDGKADRAETDAAIARIAVAEALDDLAGCDAVVEAIVEKLQVKREVFGRLEEITGPETILASNTSSLPIGAIAAGLSRRAQVAGLHFFNPVPVMKLVEVIRAPETSDAVMATLTALGKRLGRTPVAVKDTPGFLVNYGGRAYTTEGLAILQENVATPAQIDAVMRDCCGFRMGPFELMDLTGMDVNFPVTEFVHASSFADPRLRSTALHRYMLETGQLGRKAGRGFYAYGEGAERPSPDTRSDAAPARTVLLLEPSDRLIALANEAGAETIFEDDGVSPILAAPYGEDCAALSMRTGADHRRLVALDLAVDHDTRLTLMTAPGADPAVRDAVVALFQDTRAVTAIADCAGFIGQRIAAMVANLGCEMAQMGLATPHDIDTAMRLGLNYPKGPLELADHLGADITYLILDEIQSLTGDDRYRPSQWLRRRASLGLSALQA